MSIYKELFKPSPCDQCHYYDKCGENLLACSDFFNYVGYGDLMDTNRFPTTDIYNRIYGEEQITESVQEEEEKRTTDKPDLTIPLWQSSYTEDEYCQPHHPGITPLLSNLSLLSESQGLYEAY